MKINWLWDTQLKETRVKRILKNKNDPRFYIYAEKLFSRVSDPKIAFQYIPEKVFYQQWPIIKERIIKDAWARERAVFWQKLYAHKPEGIGVKSTRDQEAGVLSENRMVAQQIKNIRVKRGYTQKEMAVRLGVIQQFVSKLETGRENVTIDTLKRVAVVLNKRLMIRFK